MMTSNNGDDYIGSESCIDLQNDIVVDHSETFFKTNNNASLKSNNSKRKEKRVFPPPIPHMPWVLKRHYTRDGRLILTEHKVNHLEYFRAHRANGRLTLHLVPLHHEEEEEVPTNLRETLQNVKTTAGFTMTGISGGSSSKPLNCYRFRSSPWSILGLQVHPVRTVQG